MKYNSKLHLRNPQSIAGLNTEKSSLTTQELEMRGHTDW